MKDLSKGFIEGYYEEEEETIESRWRKLIKWFKSLVNINK